MDLSVEQESSSFQVSVLEASLREFLTSRLSVELAPDTDIFESGLGNSLMALELIVFVEESCGIVVDPEDIDVDNFRTLERLVAFAVRKQALARPV